MIIELKNGSIVASEVHSELCSCLMQANLKNRAMHIMATSAAMVFKANSRDEKLLSPTPLQLPCFFIVLRPSL